MTETTIHYRAESLRNWKLGRLHRKWYRSHSATFSERDLSNAEGQCHTGKHFAEWLIARHFLRQGYEVLLPKYLHATRPIAARKAAELLGEANVAFLKRKRKFGPKLRNSPRPDLLVFKSNPKTFFFVEVKRDADKLSSAQRQFFPMVEEKLGCEVRIVYLMMRRPRSVAPGVRL
jgi:VRR-NUC domain